MEQVEKMDLTNLEIRWPILLIFIITMLWASMMFIAPLSQPADTVDLGEHGLVHPQLDVEHKYKHIDNYFVRRIYESGDRNCHQRGSRSVYLNGNEMPYCTRDAAIFVGMAIGALISLLVFVRLDWKWVVAGLVPMAIDGTTQLFTSYESNNILRIATGLPAGLITTLALGGVLFELGITISHSRKENMARFKAQGKKGPKIPYWLRSLAIASAIVLFICGLVAADYALHDGYREDEVKLKLTAEDAPYFTANTTLIPGEEVVLIWHKEGPNLDWAKLSIIIRWEDKNYNGEVLTINGKDYDRYSNHISEKGDRIIITLLGEELPALSNVSITIREGSKTIWRSSEEIIIA